MDEDGMYVLILRAAKPYSRIILLLFAVTIGACQDAVERRDAYQGTGVVSVDYCADQYAIQLLPRARILSVSPDASKHFSYLRHRAGELPVVKPDIESILALRPNIVLRSYGGGPGFMLAMRQAGVKVVQLGYPQTLDAINDNILDVAEQLGVLAAGKVLSDDYTRRRMAIQKIKEPAETMLYTTPGGVTSGPGSLVHEMLLEAGYQNYETRPGWHELPLEQMVLKAPDAIAAATFGKAVNQVDPWTRARHPLLKKIAQDVPTVTIDGAWTSCGGWFLMDAVEAIAEASTHQAAISQVGVVRSHE